jgi:hypothetical protein
MDAYLWTLAAVGCAVVLWVAGTLRVIRRCRRRAAIRQMLLEAGAKKPRVAAGGGRPDVRAVAPRADAIRGAGRVSRRNLEVAGR